MRIHALIRFVVLTFLAAAVLTVSSGSAEDLENPALSAALQAFEADPHIGRQLAELESRGYARAPVQTIGLGGGCGVVGCNHSFLVVVNLVDERNFLAQILATVTVRAPGFAVVSVRQMQLVPIIPINRNLKGAGD